MVNEGYDSYIGKQIKNYTILQKLGSGGFACVYLARNSLNELVAIKLLKPKYNKSEGQQLFLKEVRFLQELNHQQHILPILDYGKSEDTSYIVVEYTPGGTLRERINNCQCMAINDALAILMQIGEAIHVAHQHSIVHSDIKPENILFDDKDDAVLADFGIAVHLEGNEGHFGFPRGTYAYMAPEQFDGLFTKEGDQYSLGCIAYEILTGRHPFEYFHPFSPHDRHIMKERHKRTGVRSPCELNSAIPYHMEQAILRSMAKKPSERHTTIASFVRSLQPPTGLLARSTYHFTQPFETPQSFTSTSEGVLSPVNPPDNPDASAIGIEAYEIIQPKLSVIKAVQNSRRWNSPGQTLPKNAQGAERLGREAQNAKTDDPILADLVSPSDKIRSTGPHNPLETFDIQLKGKLKTLLSRLLKLNDFATCQEKVWDRAKSKYWKYTGIAFNELGCDAAKNKLVPIPQYALIYVPAEFFTEDVIVKILLPFSRSHWTLIIFSDELGEPDLDLQNRLQEEGEIRKITWNLIRKIHIDYLLKKNLVEQKRLINDYLKLDDLPRPLLQTSEAKEVVSGDLESLREFTSTYLSDNIRNSWSLIRSSGSENLKKIFFAGIDLRGTQGNVASNIINRLNEPPYSPDESTHHTYLGEFLCILLNEPFKSSSSDEAINIRKIIRTYNLGPPTCSCYKV